MTDQPYAFDVEGAARYTGSSVWEIRDAITRKNLTPLYRGTKIKIKREELEGWIDSLPTERAA